MPARVKSTRSSHLLAWVEERVGVGGADEDADERCGAMRSRHPLRHDSVVRRPMARKTRLVASQLGTYASLRRLKLGSFKCSKSA